MKYFHIVDTIDSKMNFLQNDIYENPIKYLKKSKLNEKVFVNKLNEIRKEVNDGWIEYVDLESLITNNKIKILTNRGKSGEIHFSLLDDNGKKVTITNKISVNYIIRNNTISFIFEFLIDGDYLDFKYIFNNIKRTLTYKIDIANIKLCLLLSGTDDKVKNEEYKIYRW